MQPFRSYTFIVTLFNLRVWVASVPAASHKIPTFFTNFQNANTHLVDRNNYVEQLPLEAENQFTQPTSDFYYGSPPANPPPPADNKAASTNTEPGNDKPPSVNNAETKDQPKPQEVNKQDLASEAYKLQDEVESLEKSKDKLEEIEKKEAELSEQLQDTNYEKLNELIKKRNVLVNKISAVAKTLRREHDSLYPELKEQPIILVATNKDDEKRKANQLAHLEGFEDFMHHITSPCNLMEELRQKSTETNKSTFKTKFETEQKILDAMSLKERLNYDRNMIDHYESIMQEIEQGIRNAEDEINKSWNHFGD